MRTWKVFLWATVVVFATVVAQGAGADPLSTPAMTPPLAADPNPTSFAAGPLGKIYVTGAVTALALVQDPVSPGDERSRIDLGNAQVFIQKTDGVLQFYLQAGVYSLPALGTPYLRASAITRDTYGILPEGYLKFAPDARFSIIAGKLPTLVGAESTFTFENMNIQRGLLWNQEPAISRGIQANYAKGPLTVSVSLNDGYYSNHYTSVGGLVTYAFNPRDSLTFVGAGNASHSAVSNLVTPLAQNNGQIYNLIFTHNAGPWTITPYVQYAHVSAAPILGVPHDASTTGGALLVKYSFTRAFSLAGRSEYIRSTGPGAGGGTNLLYGPGSAAWSLTVTPTYQFRVFYLRGEASYTRVDNLTPGAGFGPLGVGKSQTRVLAETGILF